MEKKVIGILFFGFLVVGTLYVPIFLFEFGKNCVFGWLLDPSNENSCLDETKYNAGKKTKEIFGIT